MRQRNWIPILSVAVGVVIAVGLAGRLAGRLFGAGPAAAPPIALTLETKPLGAEIWLDGFPLGKVTPATIALDNGLPHEIELRREGWMKLRQALPSGQPDATLAFELREAGRMQVSSQPAGAHVSAEGAEAIPAPCTIEIPAGAPVRVTAALEGYLPATTLATVEGGQVVEWVARLRPAGIFDIASDPPGVPVQVDGLRQGTSPLSFPVEAGVPHRIEVALGSLRASEVATVEARSSRRVVLRLEDRQDRKLQAALGALSKRVAQLRARIAKLERNHPNQLAEALARTHEQELLEEEVDRLEQRQQEIEGDLASHRTALEERAASGAAR
jgi:hypothetical protein